MRQRIGLVLVAMLGLAALAALLAVEAARSARVHQYAAERVLVDYAGLGADAVANRIQGALAGRLFPLLGAVRIPVPASREALATGLPPASAALAAIARWSGRADSAGPLHAVVYDSGFALDASAADSLRAAARRLPESAYFGMLRRNNDLLVFSPLRGTPRSVAAFAIPLAGVTALLDRLLEKDPVLPASLMHDSLAGNRIGLTIRFGGRDLAARGPSDSTRFRAVQDLGPIFGGMTVEVRLPEALAPALVIGGLPRSRLPFLGAVLGLTVLLAGAAAWQLRQQERLARLREDFVAGASHELRTPLAQIRLFAETLRLERVRSEDERSRALTVIEREARRLEHLVENLLHFSRAERGTLRVAPESVDLGALTREIVAEFAPLAEKGEVRIVVEGAESLPARTDPGAWRQIVLNLLDNAVKYGGRGTRVTVTLDREGSDRRLTVSDEGPGVAPEDRERIWERFWRGDAARAAGITGTGIGLATVRDLVTLHGGSAAVAANQPRGARFIVRLPEPA